MSDKPPSRERYEQENPTVSFRIAREKKEALDDMVEALETTKKAWFESIIDDEEREYEAARESGYEAAREEYLVKVPCAICGEPIPLNEEGEEQLWEVLERLSMGGPFSATSPSGTLQWTYRHENCS